MNGDTELHDMYDIIYYAKVLSRRDMKSASQAV